jgi:hypothetical protein
MPQPSWTARASTTSTTFCEAEICAGANATFVFGPFTNIRVLIAPDGFIMLTDANGNVLPANYCDTISIPAGVDTSMYTPCTSNGVSGFIPQVLVILPAGFVLTSVGANPVTGRFALFLTSSNILLPGITYVITTILDPNLFLA